MKTTVQKEWDRLKLPDWTKYIDSIPKRLHPFKQRRHGDTTSIILYLLAVAVE
jgi:hypothetical protein